MFDKSEEEFQKMREDILEFVHPGALKEFAKKWKVSAQSINGYLRDKRYKGRTTQYRLMEMHKMAMRIKKEIQKTTN